MALIIAEIGTSHQGAIEKAKKLVDAAVDAGADAVKFQWVYADEILHPDTGFVNLPTGRIPLYQRFKELECPVSFYKELLDYSHEKGVKFCCSPFGLRSLKELLSLSPDIVKIASPELNHYPLLKALRDYRNKQIEQGQKPVPVIISSGVSTLSDIEKALNIIGKNDVTLLHCITSYPAPEDEYNVRLVKNLSSIFGVPCGISDHSLDPVLVPTLSIMCGGSAVEKHITLSRSTAGLDDPVALEPEPFALMCHCIHQTEVLMRRYGQEKGTASVIEQLSETYDKERIFKVLGTGVKELAPSEEQNYGRTNRSLHFMGDFSAGHIIGAEDIAVLRTEKVLTPGVSPEFLDNFINKPLVKDVESGAGVQFSDFF